MKTILKPIQQHKRLYQHSLQQRQPTTSKPLNLKLLSNPFIKDHQHYRAIHNDLHLYNKRVLEGLVTDQYEVDSHEKLFAIICDLANLQSGQDMGVRLEESWGWWVEQRRKVKQRKDLGVVKYKSDKNTGKIRDILEKMHHSQVIEVTENLPNQLRFQEMFPFEMNYRTAHKEMEVALRRLSEYKRKIINISDAHILDAEDRPNKDRVLYPRPKKYVPTPEQPEDNPENAGDQKPPGETQIASPQNVQTAAKASPQNAIGGTEPNKPAEVVDPNQQDLGLGLGEEPGQPQEDGAEEEAPQEDKLAPKHKIYAASNRQRQAYDNTKTYDKPYMFYRGGDSLAERRMEERTVLKQQYSLKLQRQEEELISKANQCAELKEKVTKQRQFVLEARFLRPNYSIAFEEPQKREMLSLADQKKYGFFVPPKAVSKPQIPLQDKLPFLPEIRPLQKDIRRDRLNSLKSKFTNILKLRQSASEVSANLSLCQTSPRRRDLSTILKEHSPQRQRQVQLQEAIKLKQSLGKHRINVPIKTLSQALVLDAQEQRPMVFQSPPKQLSNNPFFVQPKKKKKKK